MLDDRDILVSEGDLELRVKKDQQYVGFFLFYETKHNSVSYAAAVFNSDFIISGY